MSLEFSSHLEKLPHNRYINNPSCVPNIGLRQEDWATVSIVEKIITIIFDSNLCHRNIIKMEKKADFAERNAQ